MSRIHSFVLFSATALVGFLAMGCAEQSPPGSSTDRRVEKETRQTHRDGDTYTYEQRGEYERNLQSAVDKLNRQIDDLERKAGTAGEKARAEYRRELPELRRLRDQARVELRKVRQASPGAWEDVKQGVGKAVQDLQTAVDRAGRHSQSNK